MTMRTDDEIEVGFEFIRCCRFLKLMREAGHVEDPDYWRALNPELTISDQPFSVRRIPYSVTDDEARGFVQQVHEDGYLHTSPLLPHADVGRLKNGIERVAGAGYPAIFACVYDEFYQAFDGLQAVLSPLLGDDYLMVPEGLGAFYVDPGERGRHTMCGPTPPHRDSLGPDRRVLERQGPTILNVWIPLTDATPLNSCIYLVPASHDPAYFTEERGADPSRVPFQDIRARPAQAGSVMAWTTHLLHWGSHGSQYALGPRVSVALYVQNRDVDPYHESAFAVPSEVPFEDRLRWIAISICDAEVFAYP